jgi:hypothetical protein
MIGARINGQGQRAVLDPLCRGSVIAAGRSRGPWYGRGMRRVRLSGPARLVLVAIALPTAMLGCTSRLAPGDGRSSSTDTAAREPPHPNLTATVTSLAPSAQSAAASANASAASASASAAEGAPPPPISTITRLALHQGQGGPSLTRCQGVVWEMQLEVASGRWTYGSCPYGRSKMPEANTPLERKTGVLNGEQRAALETDYGKLRIAPASSCGHDGGTLSLTVTKTDTTTETWVDENWGCRKPPPLVAQGLLELGSTLSSMAAR